MARSIRRYRPSWGKQKMIFDRFGLWVRLEDHRAKIAEAAATNRQQPQGCHYTKVKLKHFRGVTCPKCLQFLSMCVCK
jgi:hypothetical protein